MSRLDSRPSGVARAVEKIGVHDHLCLIYEAQEEQFAAIAPFIQFGLERGERILYIADDNTPNDVLKGLQARELDLDRAINAGALTVVDKQQAYLKDGRFDPGGMLGFLAEAIHSSRMGGFSAFRVTGEMTWALGGDPGVERLMEYESKVNRLLAENDGLALCQYNRSRFPPEVIKNALHTHPTVIFAGVVCSNDNYVPPDEFLNRHHAFREVDNMLTIMLERERVEKTDVPSDQEVERKAIPHTAVAPELPRLARCAFCGMPYERRRDWQQYCSVACRQSAFWERCRLKNSR